MKAKGKGNILVVGTKEENGKWFAVAEEHEGCAHGSNHLFCQIVEAWSSQPLATREEAETKAREIGAMAVEIFGSKKS